MPKASPDRYRAHRLENDLNSLRIPNLVLASLLALLLPLEQAHCVWMRFEKPAAPAAAAAHACCGAAATPRSGEHARPDKPSAGCACEQLPTGTLPTIITAGTEGASPTFIAMVAVRPVVEPFVSVTATAPALEFGSPPLPDDPGAHGLRAPPVSA
jgi:hypothetical protein